MDIPKLMERAQEAARKRNFDYAVTLYGQILAVQPDHGAARGELRQVLARRAEMRKTSPLAARLTAAPQWAGILAAQVSRSRPGLIRACERYLQADPSNQRVNWMLAKALERSSYMSSAIAVYEHLHQIDREDTEALKRAGFLKYRTQDLKGALECYERVLQIHPRDAEAEKMRRNLAAEGTLASGSYGTARSTHELIKEKEQALEMQRAGRLHKAADEIDAEIARLKERAGSGQHRAARLELADLLARKKEYAQAREVLVKMLENITEDAVVKVSCGKDMAHFSVEGGNASVLIGKRGKTLKAMQHIVEKMVKKAMGESVDVRVDVEGYLEKRETSLKGLASKLAEKARQTGKPTTISRMDAYERKIIHDALRADRSVKTRSVGAGDFRNVVIHPGGKKLQRKKTVR